MGTLDAAKQLLGICLIVGIDGEVGREGLLESHNLFMEVRCDAKYSIHEAVHLLLQVGEGGHARGEGRDIVVDEPQPVGGNE